MNSFLKVLFVLFLFIGLFYAQTSFARTVIWNDPQTQNSSIPLYWKFFDGYISYFNLLFEQPENVQIPSDADIIISYTNKNDPLVKRIDTHGIPTIYMGRHFWFIPSVARAYNWLLFFTWHTSLDKKLHIWNGYKSLRDLGITKLPRKIVILHKTRACISLGWFWRWWYPCAPDKPHTFYFSTYSLPGQSGTAKNIQISYGAKIINSDTGEEIKNGAVIPVGTHIKLQFKQYENSDIKWIGKKYWRYLLSFLRWRFGWHHWGWWIWNENAFWSLYPKYNTGVWTDQNELPNAACRDQDLIFTERIWRFNRYFFGNLLHYVTMSVTKPNKHITGIDGMDCSAPDDNGDINCTATTPGTKNIKFVFDSTKIKAYHSYKRPRWYWFNWYGFNQCRGINERLYKRTVNYTLPPYPDNYYYWRHLNRYYYRYGFAYTNSSIPSTLYDFSLFEENVPSQFINYKITVENSNHSPNAPSLSATSPVLINTTSTISISATDLDNDTLKYGIDWNNDGDIDEWLPSSGYTTSGTSLQTQHLWSFAGEKTFEVIAEDSNGARSESISKTIDVLDHPTITLEASDYLIKKNDSTMIKWSSTGANQCMASGDWSGQKVLSGSENTKELQKFENQFILMCSNALASSTKSIYVYTYECGDNVCTDSVESCATCPADCGECDASNTANPDLFLNLTQEPPEVHYGGGNN